MSDRIRSGLVSAPTGSNGWNFADVYEVVAEQLPDAPCQVQGDRRVSWREVDRRADGVAKVLLDNGAQRQDKLALYLYNGPQYMETMFATFKAGLAPVNTNYRYAEDELVYLWDNADAVAVVFHGCFTDRCDNVRDRVGLVHTWLWVDDGSGPCPEWAIPYEQAATSASSRTVPPHGRDGDDLLLLYTGGTTGMPKGVMWRQHDLFVTLNPPSGLDYGRTPDLDKVRELCTQPGLIALPAAPLMHGTGMFTSLSAMTAGGSIVTLENRSFDPSELLDVIEREGVAAIAWVGDAFGKPVLRALDDQPGKWDISSLRLITSSGVMWSEETKQGLLGHHAGMLLADAFSSSEALGMGTSISHAGGTSHTAKFALGENARVLTDDGRDVVPGSGEAGRVAVRGVTPVGYYKDEEKSARTFIEIDGARYSIPGDYATVEADGTLNLLGRGSVCINTGGEKVFPEEVEEVLKLHPDVIDAVAVGVPDDKFGEAITAVVEAAPGSTVDESDVITHVKSKLAAYKAPKRVVVVDSIERAPNGKVDYKGVRARALEALGLS
ncbi:MAG TPA: acyl-CoA synthetase [Acidimicrobiales bacterium]|nr:acyl-CoA synthetase [Acidimicrobiales bacterium]